MQTPFRQRVATYIAAQSFDEKTKKKLVRRWGQAPEELQVGQWIDYFKQTPEQLGFSEDTDHALLYRAMEAVNIYQVAQQAARDLSSLTPEAAAILMDLQRAVSGKRKGTR